MSDVFGAGKAAEAATQLVKPVYADLAQPAVSEVGRFGAESVRAILLPVRKALEGWSAVVEMISERVADKLKDTPRDRLTAPPANVAGPLLEAVRFTEPDSPLHEMFANLLASAMDTATVRAAHPSFVTVLSQLTSDEARILRHLNENNDTPTLTIRDVMPGGHGGWQGKLRNFTLVGVDAGCSAPDLGTVYLDNLARLGVVEHRGAEQLLDDSGYKRLSNAPEVQSAVAAISSQLGHSVSRVPSFYSLTTFGRLLLKATVRPEDAR